MSVVQHLPQNAWSRYGVHTLPVYVDCTSISKNPDLWSKRPGRNRHETDQVHVLEVHQSLTNFLLLIDASVHDVPLGSGCKPRTTGDSAMMWTYSHGFKVPVELLGDRVRKITTSDRDAILRPTQAARWLFCGDIGRV